MEPLEAPGSMMRRLRLERNLTLRTAAGVLDVSPSALSRLERDMRTVDRDDVDAIILAYALPHWEASQLQMCAGLAPKPPPAGDAKAAWKALTERLATLTQPAFIMDQYNFILAWNGAMQCIWEWPKAPSSPIHALENLFTPNAHRLLGDLWEKTAQVICRHLYMRSLHVAGDPRFQKSLNTIARKHGRDFRAQWNMALAVDHEQGWREAEFADVVLPMSTREGVIEYLALHSAAHTPLPVELHVHLPIGAESVRRHERLMAGVKVGQVVRCQRTGIR